MADLNKAYIESNMDPYSNASNPSLNMSFKLKGIYHWRKISKNWVQVKKEKQLAYNPQKTSIIAWVLQPAERLYNPHHTT